MAGSFDARDKESRESLLELQAVQDVQVPAEETKEETKVVEEAPTLDLAALMLKKKQAAAASGAAKGKKGPPPKAQQASKPT